MNFNSKMSIYNFIETFKKYRGDDVKYKAIIVPNDYTDDCLEHFANMNYINFVASSHEIKKETINVIPINMIGEFKFDALLVVLDGLSEDERERAFQSASEGSIQRSVYSGLDADGYYVKLKSNTKTTEVIDKIYEGEYPFMMLGTRLYVSTDDIKWFKKFSAFEIELLVDEAPYDWFAWKVDQSKFKRENICYTFTEIKNDTYSKLKFVIGTKIFNYIKENTIIKDGKVIYFKKPFYLNAQSSKMKDATDGYYSCDDMYEPFETEIYGIIGIRLKEKVIKRGSSMYNIGPEEMYLDKEKRKDYWMHNFKFDELEIY